MKTTIHKLLGLTTLASFLAFGINTQAAIIIDGFSATDSGGINLSEIDGNWHGNLTPWSISTGTLTHAPDGSDGYNGADEGIVGQMVEINHSDQFLDISFDYNVGAGNRIYVHLRGFDATGGSANWWINTGAQNGNAWDSATNGTTYNFWDGLTLANSGDTNNGGGDEAVSFTGSGTYSARIDLATYSLGNLGDYEYLMLGFAANASTDNLSTISNLSLISTTAPEPSTLGLLLMGAGLLFNRRVRRPGANAAYGPRVRPSSANAAYGPPEFS